jgi:hypothetical protein
MVGTRTRWRLDAFLATPEDGKSTFTDTLMDTDDVNVNIMKNLAERDGFS